MNIITFDLQTKNQFLCVCAYISNGWKTKRHKFAVFDKKKTILIHSINKMSRWNFVFSFRAKPNNVIFLSIINYFFIDNRLYWLCQFNSIQWRKKEKRLIQYLGSHTHTENGKKLVKKKLDSSQSKWIDSIREKRKIDDKLCVCWD